MGDGFDYEAITWYGEDGSLKEANAIKSLLHSVIDKTASMNLQSKHNARHIRPKVIKNV